jgi:hypothetical protein
VPLAVTVTAKLGELAGGVGLVVVGGGCAGCMLFELPTLLQATNTIGANTTRASPT